MSITFWRRRFICHLVLMEGAEEVTAVAEQEVVAQVMGAEEAVQETIKEFLS